MGHLHSYREWKSENTSKRNHTQRDFIYEMKIGEIAGDYPKWTNWFDKGSDKIFRIEKYDQCMCMREERGNAIESLNIWRDTFIEGPSNWKLTMDETVQNKRKRHRDWKQEREVKNMGNGATYI